MAGNIHALQIIKLLAKRHSKDMFFTEVKDGSTSMRSRHSRMDAVAIPLSWAHYNIQGYEVKVSRSDFLNDQKWMAYLPMCNQLYWVCAADVCDISEIPEPCGLITCNGKSLKTVKKAPYREIDPPVEMYKYLMFSYIGPYWQRDLEIPRIGRLLPNSNAELAKAYANDKAEFKEIAYGFKSKLVKRLESMEGDLRRIEKMKEKQEILDIIYSELGISTWDSPNDIKNTITALKTAGMPREIAVSINGLVSSAENLRKKMEQLSGSEGRGNEKDTY